MGKKDKFLTNKDTTHNILGDNDTLNIPSYNDEVINKELEKTKRKREKEKKDKEIKRKKEEKQKYKDSLNKIDDFDSVFLMIISVSFLGAISSIAFTKMNYLVYSIISIIVTYMLARRIKKINNVSTWNTLLWNLALSIDDIFEYKVTYDLKEDYKNNIDRITLVFCFVVLLFNSNTVIYPIMFILLLISFIISFINKDIDSITEKSKLILISLIGGFVLKALINVIFNGILVLDFFNIILALLLYLLFYLLNEISFNDFQ